MNNGRPELEEVSQSVVLRVVELQSDTYLFTLSDLEYLLSWDIFADFIDLCRRWPGGVGSDLVIDFPITVL